MKITKILPIAIIAVLPFDARASTSAIITNDDKQHIATTAYVKGAYNEAFENIALVESSVNYITDVSLWEKQDKLVWSDPEGEVDDMDLDTSILTSVDDAEYPNQLVSGLGVKNAIDDVNDAIMAVDTKIDNKRVKIYTTWDNDTDAATTLVPFATAQ